MLSSVAWKICGVKVSAAIAKARRETHLDAERLGKPTSPLARYGCSVDGETDGESLKRLALVGEEDQLDDLD